MKRTVTSVAVDLASKGLDTYEEIKKVKPQISEKELINSINGTGTGARIAKGILVATHKGFKDMKPVNDGLLTLDVLNAINRIVLAADKIKKESLNKKKNKY